MRERFSGPWAFVTDNFLYLVLIVVGYLLLAGAGVIEPIEIPELELPPWYELVGLGVLVAALLGMFVGSKIIDLLPDPPRVYLVELTEREQGNAVWRLTPDAFEALTVEGGRLYQWEETKHPVYECVTFDPDENYAIGTWRESVPASEIIGKSDVRDAIDQISDVRDGMEQEARWGHKVRRRITSIIRAIDRERAFDQNAAVEGHVAPNIGDGRSADEIILEQLGELAPDFMKESQDEVADAWEWVEDMDEEALEPVEPDGGVIDE